MRVTLPVTGDGVKLIIIAVLVCATSVSGFAQEQHRGRLLVDALRALQAKGLPIVFSSAVVTPEMRVGVEPDAAAPRQQLDQLLAPHGLVAREGPGGTIQILPLRKPAETRPPRDGIIEGLVVDAATTAPLRGALVEIDGAAVYMRTDAAGRFVLRHINPGTRLVTASMAGYSPERRPIHVTGGRTVSLTLLLTTLSATHREYVFVSRPADYQMNHGIASETSIGRTQLERLHGTLADDPVRVVHAFPRVAALDDFHSEFAVRGSPYRHVNFVVDGVSTQWLRHTTHGRRASGSLSMFTGSVLGDVTLRTGAYPRRHTDRLGPQLDLTLREGSRAGFAFRGTVGGNNATVLGEGPLGSTARGSWLVALRQSYLEWPTERRDSNRTPFGFSDGLTKIVYDVRPNQQVALLALAGMSNVDEEDHLRPNEPGNAINRASVVDVSWRSTFGSSLVLRQRVYVVKQYFLNEDHNGQETDYGTSQETAYRADIIQRLPTGLLEGGAQIGRTTFEKVHLSTDEAAVGGSSSPTSGYLHFAWTPTRVLSISPGARLSASSFRQQPTVTQWVLGEWRLRPGWSVNLSAGTSQQFPDIRHVLGDNGAPQLKPERARHLDAGIEHRLTQSIRWQATMFSRRERDVLREPSSDPRVVDGTLVFPERESYRNALQARSHGIELLVERRSSTGLSGWAAYSYAKTRYTDVDRDETYWGDFDQRHTLNLFGVYQFSPRSSLGTTFRTGSGFPIPGYFNGRNGRLFVGALRNQARLPLYARLDLRGDRQLECFGRRLTLFVELLNLMNRENVAIVRGWVNPTTGEALGFTDSLLRRRLSGGIVFEF